MFVSEDLQVNAQGHLTIGGQDTVELAKQYGILSANGQVSLCIYL